MLKQILEHAGTGGVGKLQRCLTHSDSLCSPRINQRERLEKGYQLLVSVVPSPQQRVK